MKILIVGGTGLIGSAVAKELRQRHEVIVAGKDGGDIKVDIESSDSIATLFSEAQNLDAVISTLGQVTFSSLDEMSYEDFQVGLKNKLMGQVDLAMQARLVLQDGGSITLTSGILNTDPIYLGASAAMVNGAIDGFVRAASIDMPRGLRINVVSPTVITEALDKYAPYFRGDKSVPVSDVALAYSKSAEGRQTGQVYCVN